MNCRGFENACHALLDHGGDADSHLERELEIHSAECLGCRALYRRFQKLRQAIRSLPAPASASAGFAEHCLAALESEPMPTSMRLRVRPVIYWAAAAAVLFCAALLFRAGSRPKLDERIAVQPSSGAMDEPARPLTESLSDATSATIALARETSAPAARIGRQVMASAALPQGDWPIGVPSTEPRGVLESVGSQVEAGVRPLPGAARKAFGFLLPTLSSERPAQKAPASGA
jgi:hypothetical protein